MSKFPATFDHVRTPLVWLRAGAEAPSHIAAGMYGAWRAPEYWLDHWYQPFVSNGSSPYAPNLTIAHQMGSSKARHFAIALAYHRSAEVAAWADPHGDFDLALNSGDDVSLDRVFQRAHLLHRWDLLKEWYPLTWYKRVTCTPRLGAPLAAKKKHVTHGGVKKFVSPLPQAIELWEQAPGTPALELLETLHSVVLTPVSLEAEWSANGLTPERFGVLKDFAHKKAAFGMNSWDDEPDSAQASTHLWSPALANRVFDLVGFPTFPGIAKLEQLAIDATALMQTPTWQAKALAWHHNFQEWCAQFNLQNPPTWYGVHVAYRPFWWRLDLDDVLAGNVDPWADAFFVDPYDYDYEAKKAKDWATVDFWEIAGFVFAFAVGSVVLGGFVGAAFGAVGMGGQIGVALETAAGSVLTEGLGSELSGGTFADGVQSGIEGVAGDLVGAATNEIVDQIGAAAGENMNDWLNGVQDLVSGIGGVLGGISGIFGAGGTSSPSTPGITPGTSSPTLNLGGASASSSSNNDGMVIALALGAVALALWA